MKNLLYLLLVIGLIIGAVQFHQYTLKKDKTERNYNSYDGEEYLGEEGEIEFDEDNPGDAGPLYTMDLDEVDEDWERFQAEQKAHDAKMEAEMLEEEREDARVTTTKKKSSPAPQKKAVRQSRPKGGNIEIVWDRDRSGPLKIDIYYKNEYLETIVVKERSRYYYSIGNNKCYDYSYRYWYSAMGNNKTRIASASNCKIKPY